jgi:hypothetical protein
MGQDPLWEAAIHSADQKNSTPFMQTGNSSIMFSFNPVHILTAYFVFKSILFLSSHVRYDYVFKVLSFLGLGLVERLIKFLLCTLNEVEGWRRKIVP